jgi:hypothetical protein
VTETISREEIKRIKEEFVLRNTLLSPVKVAEILGYSVAKIYKMVESGDLETATAVPGKRGMRITALSVDHYRVRIVHAGNDF